MRMYDIIKKKRDGGKLSEAEINYFVKGCTDGSIPDYQISALCMAIYFQGMDLEETTALTLAVRDSGEKLDFSNIKGIRVDKHSTGGVGDKTSLVIAPIVASLGLKVAKMSGRGLGHTGGTVDKLESIPNFNTALSTEDFERIVNETGIAIVGQTATLAPADKKLYAIRDVTATVDSMPLIAASIMGKKLAADDDCIVLDVKTGSGSFMKTIEDSKKLAELMVGIGKKAGKKVLALITDMDVPLGNAIGNSLEVKEAIATLHGKGPKDFTEVCFALASDMLYLAGLGTENECRVLANNAIKSGNAFNKFREMVVAQGGDVSVIDDPSKFPEAKYKENVYAEKSGYISKVDTEGYGIASLMLGAGRNAVGENIDYSAGIVLKKKTGDFVRVGEAIATLYTDDETRIREVIQRFNDATFISDEKPQKCNLILGRIE